MLLAIDTSTAACTAALFSERGDLLGRRDEVIGRGHAERLVPMIADLLDGSAANTVLVGVGPGSFTGIRVGIAAAHGLAIGWSASIRGMSSLALLAASAGTKGPVAAAMIGGHGELFVQQFDERLVPITALLNATARVAADAIDAELIVGPAAEALVQTRGRGESLDRFPAAADALRLPAELRTLPPSPVYARAPDARVRSAA